MKSLRNILPTIVAVVLTALSAIVFGGCNTNQIDSSGEPKVESNEMYFAIRLPSSASTKANPDKFDESGYPFDSKIDHVDILLFDNQQRFVRSVYSDNIENGVNKNTHIAKVKLPNGEYYVVMLANAHDKVLANSEILKAGTAKEELLSKFTFDLGNHSNKWNSIPTSKGYRDFPMWGEINDKIKIPTAAHQNKFEIELVRMLAKINVVVEYETKSEGIRNFALDEIYVYNHNKEGYLVPKAENWGNETKQATELASASSNPSTDYLLYDNIHNTDNNGSAYPYIDKENNQSLDEIFLFESKASASSEWDANTCIVIGGYYQGSKKLNYYRIDFAQGGKPFDLVRNHSYNLTIKNIKTFGYDTPLDALKNEPGDVDYIITEWSKEEIGDVIIGEQTRLSITPGSHFEVYNNANKINLTIGTDYKYGWYVPLLSKNDSRFKIVDENGNYITWLYPSEYGSIKPGETELTINVSSYNGKVGRIGYIYITANKIEHRLKIVQSAIAPTYLEVSEKSLLFDAKGRLYDNSTNSWSQTTSVNVLINWSPREIAANITKTDVTGGGVNINVPNKTDLTGSFSFVVNPGQIDFSGLTNIVVDRESELDISLMNPLEGKRLLETVKIRHANFEITADPALGYFPNGKEYSFKVRSTVPWRVKEISDDVGILLNIEEIKKQTGTINGAEGNDFFFTIVNSQDANIMGKSAVIVLEDITGMADDEIIEIFAADCGLGGNPIPIYVGGQGYINEGQGKGRSYLAHYFGEGVYRRCWMVQDTRETNPTNSYVLSTKFNTISKVYDENSIYGFYYKKLGSTAFGGVCPPGWRLPNRAEAESLRTELNRSGTGHPAGQYWFGTDRLFGYATLTAGGSVSNWGGKGSEGIWWVQNGESISTSPQGRTSIGDLSSMRVVTPSRCVREE